MNDIEADFQACNIESVPQSEPDSTGGYVNYNNQMAIAKSNSITLKYRLESAVREAEQRLAEAKEARAILDKNPDIEKLLNIMQKGRF